MQRPLKLRFAPSPTGFLHVGGARTAIYNLLHARHHGGTFLLRIEDTDVERSDQRHAQQILESLEWLGIEYDEGPVYQSDRLDRYRERAAELVRDGLAYHCYCTVEELEAERTSAEVEGAQYRYSGKCSTSPPPVDSSTSSDDGPPLPSVIRFKVPPGAIEFTDLIRGAVRFDASLIDDFVLLRSDGNPTYHLSVVVDDIDMEITLVARGEDHLSNTPKHILLFKAFGSAQPEFAHLPLILGSDKRRLSKRTGATSTEEYRDLGIFPEALFNFLLLLGWAPGENREILGRDEAESLFELVNVHKSAAVFDVEKLLWINSQYLWKLSPGDLVDSVKPFLPLELFSGATLTETERLEKIVTLYQPRSRTLRELADSISTYFEDGQRGPYDDEAVKKHLKGDDLRERLENLRVALNGADPFDVVTTEQALRALAERTGVSPGKYIHPLRVALTGALSSPPIFDVLESMEKTRSLHRLDQLIAWVERA